MRTRWFIVLGLCAFAALSLNGLPPARTVGGVLGSDSVQGPKAAVPESVDPETGIGTGCHTDDPEHICLGIKYVAFRDAQGAPVMPEEKLPSVMSVVNRLWKQCDLSFQIDEYLAVDPADFGFRFDTATYSELTQLRKRFEDRHTLLIVATGKWDRSGSIGATSANAWTNLPGAGPYGVVLEQPVSGFAPIVAHELGHYLNLLHVSDESAVMNPVIYNRSTGFYASECDTARAAAKYFWSDTVR
jgi:hypothetical protein